MRKYSAAASYSFFERALSQLLRDWARAYRLLRDVSLGRAILSLISAFILSGGLVWAGTSPAFAAPQPSAYFLLTDVPGSAPIGSLVKFKVRFKNTAGGSVGYAPFIDLALDFRGADANNPGTPGQPCDGLSFVSANIVGVNAVSLPVTSVVSGNASPANCTTTPTSVAHPYQGVGNVSFPQGWQVVTLGLPFGSYDATQPEIVVEVTAQIHNHADLNYPLNVCERGGFRFGAAAINGTPLMEPGAGSAVGTWACKPISPTVISVGKASLVPEGEIANGPNFAPPGGPDQYAVTVDLATGQTIGGTGSAPLSITDCLPAGMMYHGNLVVSAPASWGAYTSSTPAIDANGCVTVTWPQAAGVVGQPGQDVIIKFDFWASNTANAQTILDDTCTPKVLVNPLTVSGDWTPIDKRDPKTSIGFTNPTADKLAVKCLPIHKSVAIVQDTGFPGPTPGDLLQYTLEFDVSDYKTIGNIRLVDHLSDGHVTSGVPGATFSVRDQFGTYTNLPLAPTYITSSFDASYTYLKLPACPIGATAITFDLSAALAGIPPANNRHAAGILTGGLATSPNYMGGPTKGKVVFYAKIGDAFANQPNPPDDGFVDKHDNLCNWVDITGSVYKNELDRTKVPGTVVTPQGATDDSGAVVTIVADKLVKSVYAVKRGASYLCGPSTLAAQPCAPGQQISPGDLVTFRIHYVIPSGDAQNISLVDWLPLPTFNVPSTVSYNSTCSNTPPPAPPAAWVGCLPSNDLTPLTGGVFTTPATNSLTVNYGTISNPSNTPKTIDLLFTLPVTNAPLEDALYLTNETTECEDNSFGARTCQTAAVNVQVREPKLRIQKGVIATSNNYGAFDAPPVTGLVAQAPAGALFGLNGVTSVVTNAALPTFFDSNLSNVDASDYATFAIVIQNTGGYPAFNVQLTDLFPVDSSGQPNCFTLVANTIKIRNGASNAPLVAGITTTASGFTVNLANSIAANNPSGSNIIIITFQVQLLPKTSLKTGCCENQANITQYTADPAPGAPNFVTANFGGPFQDTARICTGPSAASKCVLATSEAHTSPQQSPATVPLAIGEIARFRLLTTIPEGTTKNLQIKDLLPVGLTYLPGTAKITFLATTTVTNTAAIPTLPTVGPNSPCSLSAYGPPLQVSDTPGTYPFGTGTDPTFPATAIASITNNDNDPDLEYLIIDLNVQVDNIASNQNAISLSNTFQVTYTDNFSGQPRTNVSPGVNVQLVEPALTITKSASPATVASAGGAVSYTVVITNTGTATAFDIAFTDTLPTGFTFGAFTQTPIAPCTSSGSGQSLSVSCPSLAVGASLTIAYSVNVAQSACPGINNADVVWTSLPGPKGTQVNATGSPTTGTSGAIDGERNGTTAPASLNDYRATASKTVACGATPAPTMIVGKLWTHPQGITIPSGVSFNFTIDCSDPNNSSTPHIIQTGSMTSPQFTPINVSPMPPVGWTCHVTETVPAASGSCYWSPGISVLPDPVTIQPAPTINVALFKNNYICVPPNQNYDIDVTKFGNSASGYFITVQNVGNQPLTGGPGGDTSHIVVTDYMPVGTVINGVVASSDWSCGTSWPTGLLNNSPYVTCQYVGVLPNPFAQFAALSQIKILAVPGNGSTTYISAAGQQFTVNPYTKTNGSVTVWNCILVTMSGTTTGHDDQQLSNNQACIGF